MSINIITKTIYIDGMTCVNCENKIEKTLQDTQGIVSVKVSYSTGKAKILFDKNIITIEQIINIIERQDYIVSNTITDTKSNSKISTVLGVGLIIFALYVLINRFNGFSIFNTFPQAEEGMGYGILFVIGLLTSIHCIAMCGGIGLSQCVPNKPNFKENNTKTVRPSLLYNIGRVVSYTVIGGIVGALGSVVSFSGAAKGIVQLFAGIFMVIMGLNMLNIFPWLRKFNLRMPKFFAKKINKQKRSNSPFFVGLLNGLMPCGPLQAMQLYALSTGDPLKGALAMFFFSLGTVPLMFGLGALSTLLSKKFSKKMMTVSAVLIVVLGVYMFSNGMSLSGYGIYINNSNNSSVLAILENDNQTVSTKLYSGRYEQIIVQKGIPVIWIIKAQQGDINGCNNEIYVPNYNITRKLRSGDNIIEFTPTQSGIFSFSCWMGMIKSKIIVVEDINNIE